MLETVRNAWKVEDLRKKILYTLLMLLIFRIGTFIPIPGVDSKAFGEAVSTGGILGFFDILTGGAFGNFTLFAMGITPYINSSIIIQLLTMAIPKLEALQKEGEEGRKKDRCHYEIRNGRLCLHTVDRYYHRSCKLVYPLS